MRLWKILAYAVMIIALGHLIFLFEYAGPTLTPISSQNSRHVILDYDFFPILCDLLIVVILIGGFKGSLRLRKNPHLPDEEYSWWTLMIARISGLALIAVLYVFMLRSPLKTREFLKIFEAFGEIRSGGEEASQIMTRPTSFEHFLVILLSVVIVVIIAILIVSMITPSSRGDVPVAVPLGEFIHRKRKYTFDGSPRERVIDAYGAALESLQAKKIHIPEHYTPWEMQQKIANPYFTTLTRLFEKARYSIHTITKKDSQKALHTLELFKKEDIQDIED
jgi:hypothetical protein